MIKINGQVTAEMYPRLKKAIETVKNTRSWLEGVSLSRAMAGTVFFAGVTSVHKRIDVFPMSSFKMPDVSGTSYFGGTVSVHKKIGGDIMANWSGSMLTTKGQAPASQG